MNRTADGNGEILGAANVTLFGNDPPPPDPPTDPGGCNPQPEYEDGPQLIQEPCY
ncbi:MAG: hypothetical protein MSG64_08005 [Pyrinomonadaceae bacterium MAG19_C2-C3]|nr:hypothetical protein [Pyrinomonadaceae bacterium MAG19_C2-C3]